MFQSYSSRVVSPLGREILCRLSPVYKVHIYVDTRSYSARKMYDDMLHMKHMLYMDIMCGVPWTRVREALTKKNFYRVDLRWNEIVKNELHATSS